MKALADLDYDELAARAAAAARLPALDDDGDDYAGLDYLDTAVRSGYGQVAVTSDEWLRTRANVYLAGLPDVPQPLDALRRLDEDALELVLAVALYEIDLANRHLRAFDPGKHKRWPKGHPQAGKFRPMVDLLKEAIARFDRKTDKHPFELFTRPQLMKAARDRGITLSRGEDRDSIADKLLADLDPNAKPAKATPAPVKKAAPAKKATAAAKKAAVPTGPDDGLDKLDEHRLRSLALEWDVDDSLSRDQKIDALRALGALAPDVNFRRTDERKGLLEHLKNIGRRPPADDGPLDRAVIALADGVDQKTVAKQLRKEADSVSIKQDADTLRFLASEVVKKKAPPILNDRGRIDLVKLAQHHGVDIRRWMPQDKAPDQGLDMFAYRGANPFDPYFRRFRDDLGNPAKPTSKSKAVAMARTAVAHMRDDYDDAVAGRNMWSRPSRENDRKHYIERGLQAAADLERLVDLAEAAKVPPGKRAVTLGATSLGEVVPIDEARFRTIPIKRVLKHRGEVVPEAFVHKGLATSLLKNPNRPHRPGLTKDESYAMDLYTAVAVADGLNGSLRKGRNVHGTVKIRTGETIDLDKVQRDMDAAIANGTLDRDTVLWRGALVANADYRRIVPGAVLSETGYLSTTSHEKAARDIIAWRQQQPMAKGRQPVLFKFLAPAGTNAALGHEALSEAVLPHGQEARVVRLDESVSPPVAILEVIPRDAEPGFVRGRDLVEDFDYDSATAGPSGTNFSKGVPDSWLGEIQKAQGFDGKPRVVSRQDMDESVRGGALPLFRAVRETPGGKTPAELAEQYRSGDLYPGTGVYGNGTYASPDLATARKYGDEKTMLRMVLRRDAKVISIEDLHKLRPRTGITPTASKLADQRQAELAQVDPKDTAAIKVIVDKYEALADKQGSRSRVAQDLGRVAALLGYDAIYVPSDYRGTASKLDNQTEYVILNRTATIVEEAQP